MAAAYRPRFSDASTTYGDGPQVSDRVTADRTFAPPDICPLGLELLLFIITFVMPCWQQDIQFNTHTHTVIHANMGSLFWIVVGLLGLGLRLVHST